MTGDIWLAIIVLLPILSIYLLRADAAAVFLSLCLGYVLYSFDAHNTLNVVNSLNTHLPKVHLKPSDITINLILLIAPAVITLLIQTHSVRGSRKVINLLPAAFCGLVAALFIVPALPVSLAASVAKTAYWGKLVHYQTDIIGIGGGLALVFLWLNHKQGESKKHAHKFK